MNEHTVVEIVEAIAEERGAEPTDLEYSLQEYIETDALRMLANSQTDLWVLSFECPDGTVTVTGEGAVHLDCAGEVQPATQRPICD